MPGKYYGPLVALAILLGFLFLCCDMQHLLSAAVGYTPPEQPCWVGAKRGDGFGAQYHAKMCAFAVSRRYPGLLYRHAPFEVAICEGKASVGGHNVPVQMAARLDAFTGLRDDEPQRLVEAVRIDSFDTHPADADPSAYYNANVRSALRHMYFSTPKPDPVQCDVAVHVRRGDVSAWGQNLSKNRLTSNQDILQALTQGLGLTPSCKIALFSEGRPADFGPLMHLPNLTFHLNLDLFTTFHSLVCAPTLVTASSSLSYAAALLSAGRVCYIHPFWHKALAEWQHIGR